RGGAVTNNVAGQRSSVGKSESVASRTGCQIPYLPKENTAAVSAAAESPGVVPSEAKGVTRVGATQGIATPTAEDGYRGSGRAGEHVENVTSAAAVDRYRAQSKISDGRSTPGHGGLGDRKGAAACGALVVEY